MTALQIAKQRAARWFEYKADLIAYNVSEHNGKKTLYVKSVHGELTVTGETHAEALTKMKKAYTKGAKLCNK